MIGGMSKSVQQLAIGRIVIGVSSWFAPRLSGRLFGLDAVANPQAPYLARLFGVRDIALGVGALQSSGAAQKQWLQLGVLCDVADALAGVAAKRDGSLRTGSALLVTGVAVAAAAQGAAALKAADAPA